MSECVLITGVAGLIGSNLAKYLITKGINVIGIDDLSGGYVEYIPNHTKFYKLNLTNDVKKLQEIFVNHKIDYVYHFAAYAAEGLSPFIRSFNYNNNLIATTNIINECIRHDVKRLIFTSSIAVYGRGKIPFSEDQLPNPIDPYGVAKYACEMDIRIAGEQHNLDWCILRPHNVYGENQNIWDKYRNVLGIWMYQYLNNMPMTIYGDGLQKRAFSYIDDSLEPIYNAAINPKASKQIINIGGTQEITINEAADTLINIIGDGKKSYLESRHEVKYSYPTSSKSEEILSFKHTKNIEDGLTQMWEWAKKQPLRSQFKWENYELDSGMYSFWK